MLLEGTALYVLLSLAMVGGLSIITCGSLALLLLKEKLDLSKQSKDSPLSRSRIRILE